MTLPPRVLVHGATSLAVLGVLALGALWLRDRTRRWEVPRWTAATFVPIRADARPAGGARATWVAVINPRCSRCVVTLQSLHGRWLRSGRPERLVALIVDTAVRPDAAALRTLPPVAVWWDRHGVWRRRWGHRLYGELIEFDVAGNHVRTIAGDRAMREAQASVPGGSPAPVTEQEGGT